MTKPATKPERRPRGRPAGTGQGRTARIEWRTTPEIKASAEQQAGAAGMALSHWLDQRVLESGK